MQSERLKEDRQGFHMPANDDPRPALCNRPDHHNWNRGIRHVHSVKRNIIRIGKLKLKDRSERGHHRLYQLRAASLRLSLHIGMNARKLSCGGDL